MRAILLGVLLSSCVVEAPEPAPAPEPIPFPLPLCKVTHCTTVECPDDSGEIGVCICHWPPVRDVLCRGVESDAMGDGHDHTHGAP